MKRLLLLVSACFLHLTCQADQSDWKTIELPGIRMDFPVSWRVLSGSERLTIQTWLQLTAMDQGTRDAVKSEKVLLHAIAPDSKGYASIQLVRSPPENDLSPENLNRTTSEQIRQYGNRMRRGIESAFQGSDMRLLRWDDVRRVKVGGQPALSLRYSRSGPLGDVEVEQLHFSTRDALWMPTFSWRSREASTWAPTIDRMRGSLSLVASTGTVSSLAPRSNPSGRCTALLRDRTAAMVAGDWRNVKSLSERYISSCQSVVSVEDSAMAWEAIAMAARESNDSKATLEASNRCIALFYRNAACHLQKAEALFRLGRNSDAMKTLGGAEKIIDHLLEEASSDQRSGPDPKRPELHEARMSNLRSQKELAIAMRLAYGN